MRQCIRFGDEKQCGETGRRQPGGGNRPKRTALRTAWPDNLSKQSAQTTYPNDRTQAGKRTYTDDRTRAVNRTIAERQNDGTETGAGSRCQPVNLYASMRPQPPHRDRGGIVALVQQRNPAGHEIQSPAVPDVDELLGIAFGKREPGALYLHHDAVSGTERMGDVLSLIHI